MLQKTILALLEICPAQVQHLQTYTGLGYWTLVQELNGMAENGLVECLPSGDGRLFWDVKVH